MYLETGGTLPKQKMRAHSSHDTQTHSPARITLARRDEYGGPVRLPMPTCSDVLLVDNNGSSLHSFHHNGTLFWKTSGVIPIEEIYGWEMMIV
jgi:hypothetical protein